MSIMHWVIVIGVVVLLFERGKILGLMGDVAQGMKSFKKGLQDDETDKVTLDESRNGEGNPLGTATATLGSPPHIANAEDSIPKVRVPH